MKDAMVDLVMESYDMYDSMLHTDEDMIASLPEGFTDKYLASMETDEYGFVKVVFNQAGLDLSNEVMNEQIMAW